MNSIALADGATDGIGRVRDALKTDIISIFQRELDQLRTMTRQDAYDMVMNNPTLLDGCFQMFRARPHLFRGAIIDTAGAPVTRNDAVLSCGRSLGDAITLIVRAAAKRYFRTHSAHIPGCGGKADGNKAAEALYNSLKDYLVYEWQSRLIPSYLRLPTGVIERMRDQLLEFREEAELTSLVDADEPLMSRRPPLLLDTANRVLVKGRETIDPEILWKVCQGMDLARLYPGEPIKALRVAVAQIAAAQASALSPMMPVLGKDIRRFCVFLFVVHAKLGAARFKAIYGEGGQVHVVRRWMERMGAQPTGASTLADLTGVFEAVISAGSTSG